MALPFGLGAVLMFTTPELSMNGKIIYAWVTYLVMSLIYTAINIPYCSVGGVITLNQKSAWVVCHGAFSLMAWQH
jgi:Na+/melibiose symporter-like transporter